MKNKPKLLVSFSGGETSAFMAQWLWKHHRDDYDMIFVFANTGQENEETLEFVQKCADHFGFPVVWVEAVVHHGKRKASTHRIVDFETASRDGEPFEEVIRKYGIPNQAFPHCTRETKLGPITSYAKSVWGKEKYYTAIGIREDEMDRMNKDRLKNRLVYPLIDPAFKPMTKIKINTFWSFQPFRLELKGYQGNCRTCWKKHDPKLYLIAQENPQFYDFMARMEEDYPRVGAEFRKDPDASDRTFFRKNRSVEDILREAEEWDGTVVDDSDIYESESCEVFSNCGDLYE